MSSGAVCILAIVLAFAPAPLRAETPLRLSLREAINLALRSEFQPRLQAVQAEKHLAEANAAQSRALTATHLDAGLTETANRFDLRSLGVDLPQVSPFVSNVSLPSVVGPFSLLDMRFTARKALWDRGASRQISVANSRVEAAEAGEARVRQQIAADAAKSYFGTVYAESTLAVAERNVKDAEYLLGFESERKRQGLVSAGEVRRAQIEVYAAQQRTVAVRSDYSAALLELKAILGIPFTRDLELTEKLEFRQKDTTVDQALASAVQSRPEMQRLQLQLKTLQLTAEALEAQKLPALAAFGSIGGVSTAPTPVRSEPASISYTYTAGLSLHLPIRDGGRRAAQLAEVGVRRRELEDAARVARNEVELRVRVAIERMHAAAEQVDFALKQATLADEDLAQTRALYESGEAGGISLAEAQTQRSRLQAQYGAAVYQHNLARLAVGDITGTLLSGNW